MLRKSKRLFLGHPGAKFFGHFPAMEFFNSVGPDRWSGQSGKELVLAAPFLHPEMERQAMEVGRSGSGGFSDTEQQRGSKFRAQSSG
jgi:hypothetical protein